MSNVANANGTPLGVPFFHESRRRIGGRPDGRPCWLRAEVALPHMTIDPRPGSEGRVWYGAITVPSPSPKGGWAHSWAMREFSLGEVALLLEAWYASPEETLRRVFGIEPPDAASLREAPPSTPSRNRARRDEPGENIATVDIPTDDLFG